MNEVMQQLFASQFVNGMMYYDNVYTEQDKPVYMVLSVKVEGCRFPVKAIVDTGSQWCVLAPSLFEMPEASGQQTQDVEKKHLMVRGMIYEGQLIRVGITLEADYGEDLTVDATVFVPTLDPDDVWPWPNFLGLEGLLNRIRRAIDPTENAFYFGPV